MEMCSGINEFNKGYQVRSNLEKDENSGRLADFYSILNGCKNHLSQFFFNLRAADNFRQVVGYTAKLLIPELQKDWEFNAAVNQLFIHFRKAYGSLTREPFNNIIV
jgi:hypothetical protein